MAQVRVPSDELVTLLEQLVTERLQWADVMSRFVVVNVGGDAALDEAEDAAASSQTESASKVNTTSPVIIDYTPRGSFSRPNPHYIPAAAGQKA
jgi:hypothetical protein